MQLPLPEAKEPMALATEAQLRRQLLGRFGDRIETIGRSEAGRPILGWIMGSGPLKLSLVAGAHADEPVGSMTLGYLAEQLLGGANDDLLSRCTFFVVLHANPDGAAANEPWIERWPDAMACLKHIVREPPGRDIEFGYPDLRVENRAVSAFLKKHGPFDLHASLHGMTLGEGGLLLIERTWADRTRDLRRRYAGDLAEAGLELFDHDRAGEKGFEYLGPGFSTTPRGEAMREHFQKLGDPSTAKLFRDSSMEWVRSLGGNPLALVTELPLFVLRGRPEPARPGVPVNYLKLRARLPDLRLKVERGEDVRAELAPFDLQALPVETAVRLQIRALQLGLEAVT